MQDHGLCRDFHGRKHDPEIGREIKGKKRTTLTRTNKGIMVDDGMMEILGLRCILEFGACLFSNEYS